LKRSGFVNGLSHAKAKKPRFGAHELPAKTQGKSSNFGLDSEETGSVCKKLGLECRFGFGGAA